MTQKAYSGDMNKGIAKITILFCGVTNVALKTPYIFPNFVFLIVLYRTLCVVYHSIFLWKKSGIGLEYYMYKLKELISANIFLRYSFA